MNDLIITICVVASVLLVLLLVRNELVFRANKRAIKLVSEANKRLIKSGLYSSYDFWSVYDSYPSYNAMMLDLRKWTFKQFYPGLEEKVVA